MQSERLRRVYGFLNHRGIHLHTTSTDECVRSYWPQLVAALADVEAGKVSGCAPHQIEAMARDLRGIMHRLPQNRADGGRAAATREAAPAADVERALLEIE